MQIKNPPFLNDKNMWLKLCSKCDRVKHVSDFPMKKNKIQSACRTCGNKYARSRRQNPEYRFKVNQYVHERRKKLRKKVFLHLRGSCVKCGFDDWRALQVDHVNGGGVKEINNGGSSFTYLKKILEDTSGKYQLLCANCNWIKRYENNECGGPNSRAKGKV